MEQENYLINIDNCIADRTLPAVIRNLFVDIRDKGYISVGDFFKDLNDGDLYILRDISEVIVQLEGSDAQTKEQDDAYSNIMMLGLGLTVGEGLEIDPNSIDVTMKVTMSLIALECLSRTGHIDVYRENWSMDPDTPGIIAKAKK